MLAFLKRLVARMLHGRHGMSKLDFRTFGGLVPKVAPQLLPDTAAQTATNVDVRRGDLRPVNTILATETYAGGVGTCGVAGTTTIATWAAISNGRFKLVQNGSPGMDRVCNFTGVQSMHQVADVISLQLGSSGGTRCLWNPNTSRFLFFTPGDVSEYYVTALAAPSAGTNISGSGYLNGLTMVSSHAANIEWLTNLQDGAHVWFIHPIAQRVAQNPIQNDTYNRKFFSGFGKLKQLHANNASYVRGGIVGVPAPTVLPVVSATAKGSVTWTRTWYAYYEEPDGTQVDAFTEGVDFTVVTTTPGAEYHTHVAGVDAIPAKVTATANAVFVLYFDAYDAAGSLLGRLYPQHSAYKDNSDLFINGAEVTGDQVNTTTAAVMILDYDTSRVSDYSIDRKYVYSWLNFPFDQESAPSPASATVAVSPAQNATLSSLGVFDPALTYNTGDVVLYWAPGSAATASYLYTCNSDGVTGVWTASEWNIVEDTANAGTDGTGDEVDGGLYENDLNADTIRVYRTVTTSAGTQYQFVADIDRAVFLPTLNLTWAVWRYSAGPAVNKGGGKVGIPMSMTAPSGPHPFRGGAYVTLTGTTNYNGNYYLDATTSASEIVITAAFVAETFSASVGAVQGRSGQHQMNLDNSAVVDHTPQVAIACTGHGFLAGESITIAGTTNYNGTFTVHASTTANAIWITAAYVAETPPGTATAKWATLVSIFAKDVVTGAVHGLIAGEKVDISDAAFASYIGAVVSSSTTTNELVFTATQVNDLVHEGYLRPYSPRAYIDSIADADCGDVLATADWAPPPDTLDGLVNAPGGFLAGFVGNVVYCSAQYYPHAWPYQYSVPHTVVGLGISGNMIVVLTEGDPYALVGDSPGALSLIRIPLKQSCVSIQSIVSHLGKVYYASPDGIAVIAGGEGALLTANLWTRAQWQALTPTSCKCQIHDEQLYINFGTASTYILDLSGVAGGQLTFADETINALYADPVTDLLYTTAAGYLRTINGGATAKLGTWKSKDFLSPKPVRWSSGKVLAESYLAANVVTNGTFTTDATGWSGWTGLQWEWYSGNGGTLYHTGGNTAPANQTIASLVSGRAYRVTYTVYWFFGGAGSVTVSLGGTSGTTRTDSVSYDATYVETIIAGASNSLITFTPTSTFDGCRIDNVIVEPIDTILYLYADGSLSATIPVLSASPFRIPVVTPKRRWSVQIETYATAINQVCLGTSMGAMIQMEQQV